jgi:Protein of unknown function (DUF2281)
MSTIDTIVRELEKIPEPMQLSVLDFIRYLGSKDPSASQAQKVTETTTKNYPLRGMPIQIAPDFDEPMTDLWAALGE